MPTARTAPTAEAAPRAATTAGTAELPRTNVRAPVSSIPESSQRYSVTDVIAGLMAAGSILLSFIATGFGVILTIEPRPARLAPVAAIVALVAGRMSVRYQRLALAAVFVSMVAFVVGMSLAVITKHPII